jgi:HSP20 family protein
MNYDLEEVRKVEIERWDMFKEIAMIHDEVDRIFQNFFKIIDEELTTFTPPINILDDGDRVLVQVALPGVKKEDIDLSLQERTLIISGIRVKADKPHYQQEWQYGSFERKITIPVAIKDDDLRADYTDGILTVSIPKSND